jgi:AcrR family transcriptional regulator
VSAALAIVDQVGIDALTVRAVAKQVGAPVMTLYTHFDNKGELLDLMHAEVARQLYEDKGNPTWQAELLAVCRHYRATLVEHPRWAPLLARPVKAVAVPFRERVLRLMEGDGFTPEKAAAGLTGAMLLAFGLTLVELTMMNPEEEPAVSREAPARTWPTLPPASADSEAEPPEARRAESFDNEKNLDFVVETYIRGLEEERQKPGPPDA